MCEAIKLSLLLFWLLHEVIVEIETSAQGSETHVPGWAGGEGGQGWQVSWLVLV